LGHRLIVFSLRLRKTHLSIAGVEVDDRLASFHRLIVLHVNGGDRPIDSGCNWIQMPIDLRVIGVLVRARVEPPAHTATYDEHSQYAPQDQSSPAFLGIDGSFLFLGRIRVALWCLLVVVLRRVRGRIVLVWHVSFLSACRV
jgi:hypothetical protein